MRTQKLRGNYPHPIRGTLTGQYGTLKDDKKPKNINADAIVDQKFERNLSRFARHSNEIVIVSTTTWN